MDIVSSFTGLLQVFVVTMTPTTRENVQELAVGWVFAPRRTIMGMLEHGEPSVITRPFIGFLPRPSGRSAARA